MTHVQHRPGGMHVRRLCLLIAVTAALAFAAAAAIQTSSANAYYEEYFCGSLGSEKDKYLSPFPYGWCIAREYHHLAKVSANAIRAGDRVCAASVNEAGTDLNSDLVCADGYVTKYLNGQAGRGYCANRENLYIWMDYCVHKF